MYKSLNISNYYRLNHQFSNIFLTWLVLILLVACASPGEEQVPGTPTMVNEPTQTLIPTEVDTNNSPTPAPTNKPKPSAAPQSTATPTPTEKHQELEQESFKATYEDHVIRGILIGDGEIAVVLAPMFDTTRSVWMPFARELAALGYTTVAFDYPGFGSSSGNFTWSGVKYDTRAVIDYLVDQEYEQIVCIGASLGANGCYDAAQLEPGLAGMVLISDGVSSVSAEGSQLLTMPKLLVYGDEDAEITNIMQAIYQSLPEPKQLEVLPDKGHGTGLLNSSETLRNLIIDFLESIRQG